MSNTSPGSVRSGESSIPDVQTCDPTVGIAHYPEGAGHATRMLAIGKAFERRGAEITIAGGGPGTEFLDVNDYEYYVPTEVNYIDTYQKGGGVYEALKDSVSRSNRRVRDLVGWLRQEDPELLVTDDMFAAIAAPIARTPFYFVSHDPPGIYEDHMERLVAGLMMRIQDHFCRAFFYTTVWDSHAVDPTGVERVPPLALEVDGATPEQDVDVLLVPSHYSTGFEDLERRLRGAGRDVTHVGGEGWESVPTLLPYIRAASVVVCSGYSTIMEAGVGNTPCVIYPFTDEQHGVSRVIEEQCESGFAVVESPEEVPAAVARPPEPPSFQNGAAVVAERVLSDR